MAKTPFAEKPLGQQQGEDVVHGQDEQVEEEEEGCGEEDEIILDDGSGGELAGGTRRLSRTFWAATSSLLAAMSACSLAIWVAVVGSAVLRDAFRLPLLAAVAAVVVGPAVYPTSIRGAKVDAFQFGAPSSSICF